MSTIHPTAVIHPGANLGADCEIGPYCVIGEHVVLGDRCKLHSHVVIDGHTQLGTDNEVFPFASLGLKSQDLKWQAGVNRTIIGDRNVFREGVTVHSATKETEVTRIGDDNLFLIHSHVAHDCHLGSHIIVSAYAGIAGHVHVEDHAILSAYAGVHQFCRVGCYTILGGAAKVTQDAPPYMLVDGSPAETKTINKIGLERHGFPPETIATLRQAYKIIFREGLAIGNALARIENELPPLPEIRHLVEFIRASKRGVCR
jgi:UDP-N-acetylglucosamine acyltransferase